MIDYTIDSAHLLVREYTQVFLDNLLLEYAYNVTRRWHQPARHGAGPVIQNDRPWEHVTYFTYSNYIVLRDPIDGLIKCWYEDLQHIPPKDRKKTAHAFKSRLCYATSEDGVHFDKPELDICQVDGRKTNIVLGNSDYGDVHSAGIVIDPNAPTEDQRFRTLFTHMWVDGQEPKARAECAHSADGIHWKLYDQSPTMGICGSKLGDVSCIFYEPESRQFVQNTRHMAYGIGFFNLRNPYTPIRHFDPHYPHAAAMRCQRRVYQSRSSDFIHWSDPVLVVAADDDLDNLDESMYGMMQSTVGKTRLATCGVLRAVDNEMDVQLLLSRDGVRWKRTNKHQPFLAPRGEGHWDAHMVSLTSPPIEVDDELWFYHGGASVHHDWWMDGEEEGFDHPEVHDPSLWKYAMGVARLRKDGFASLDTSPCREGVVGTHPLLSGGTRLLINAKCRPGGSIHVEVVDRYNDPIEPCTKQNCDPVTGDSIEHTVTWKGSPEVPAGRHVRRFMRKLRFFLKDAEIFSFRFADSDDDVLASESSVRRSLG